MIKFSDFDKKIGDKLFKKIKQDLKKDSNKWPILTFEKLFEILNKKEKQLIEKILTINCKEYDIKLPFLGIESVPKNLIIIENQKYELGKKIEIVRPQYLPKNVFLAYQQLNQVMEKDINRSVNVLSGYRSPAYQSIVYFSNLYLNNWNVKKTLKKSFLPGYSNHGYSKQQAIDFAPKKGIKNLKNFYKTKEYKWSIKNARKFNFYLSYSKNNKFGIVFEPWHWHYKV